jgi:hypothetical protein
MAGEYSIEKQIAYWNTRAPDATQAARIAELEGDVERQIQLRHATAQDALRNLERAEKAEAELARERELFAIAAADMRRKDALIEEAEAERDALRKGLEEIAQLDPALDSDDGHNEWGEAECFDKAQFIARQSLDAAMSAGAG